MTGAPLAPGSRIDAYEIVHELGRGAVGETFAARVVEGPLADQLVCLKVLAREFRGIRSAEREAAIKHLRHEARVATQLDHPNIARLLDSGVSGDLWYLAFELVEGADLSAFGADAFEPDHVAHLALELSKALACAHDHDVLHRDIKPSNILISTSGQVKLVDFGLAKLDAGAASQFSQHVGTPRYFSPEQLRGEPLTAATDIYSLGLVLFELLAGVHPFYDPDVDAFRRNVLQGTLRARLQGDDLPEDLVAIVERCVELDSSKRFANGAELHHALSIIDQGVRASDESQSEIDVLKVAAGGSASQAPTRLGSIAHRVAGIRDEPGDFPTRVIADPTAVFRDVTRIASQAETAADAHRAQRTGHLVGDLSRIARAVAEQQSSDLEQAHPHRSGVRALDEGARQQKEPGARIAASSESSLEAAELREERATQREAESAPLPAPSRWTRSSTIAALCMLLVATGAAVLLLGPGPEPSVPAGQGADPAIEAKRAPKPAPETPPAATAPRPEGPAETEASLYKEAPQPPALPRESPEAPEAPSDVDETPRSSTPENAERARRSRAASGNLVSVTIGTIPYGEVIVDGKRVGSAPVVVKLTPGPHRIVGRSQRLRRAETIVVSPEMNHVVLDLRNDQAAP